jgi:hypothetical protein
MSYFYGVDEFNASMERRQQDAKAERIAKKAFISGKPPVKKKAKRKSKKQVKKGFFNKLLNYFFK